MKKYRPYFTLAELEILSSSLRSSQNPSIHLLRYLDKFISDIKAGLRKENHTLKPSLAESLELEPSSESFSDEPTIQALLTYHAKRGFIGLSVYNIHRLQMYRYENDLMDSQEESQFEFEQRGIK